MIEELRIQGIGVIDEARIELGPGLTVITGETGAGKTMVLSGLDLLRGSRADTGVLRSGEAAAEVDAVVTVDIDRDTDLITALEALGVPVEDGMVITRRTVAPGGRSRAHLSGRPVPISSLAQVWSHLVSVHGQMDQARLREGWWQRQTVDDFGGADLLDVRDAYDQAWHEWQAIRSELAELQAGVQERERTAALLRLGIAEIDEVAPEPGEDESLDAEAEVLAHVGALRDATESARGSLAGVGEDIDTSAAISKLAQAHEVLAGVAGYDQRLAELAARLKSLVAEASDVEADLGDYVRGLDADPDRQAWVEDRRAKLTGLRKSYGATIDAVLAWRAQASEQISAADTSEARIAELHEREEVLAARVVELAGALSAARRMAAHGLCACVGEELTALAMPQARVEIEIDSTTDPERLRSHGGDDVRMMLIAHPGAPARPLGKGASGGELSRLALAFEVALAGRGSVPTMIFDEVDAGVGGSVAVEVGRRLARLAAHVQVIVVTHLPQVAAFANRHLVVTKSDDGTVTSADVRTVADEARVAELVRMLSGLEGSTTGAAHALELLAVAQAEASAGIESGTPPKRSLSASRSR